MDNVRERLRIREEDVNKINHFLLREDNPLVNGLLDIVEKYGGVEEINDRAREARKLEYLMHRLGQKNSPYVKDLEWLREQMDMGAFISIPEYRRKILGDEAESMEFDDSFAVTLEISACNFFPWLIEEAKRAIAQQDLMPARYI